MTKFYDSYKAVFDAIKTALVYVPAVPAHDEVPEVPAHGVPELKTVLVGEQFTLDSLPKATINPIPGPITSASSDGLASCACPGSYHSCYPGIQTQGLVHRRNLANGRGCRCYPC